MSESTTHGPFTADQASQDKHLYHDPHCIVLVDSLYSWLLGVLGFFFFFFSLENNGMV